MEWFAIFKRIHEVWMTKTLQKIFWIFCSSMRRLTRFLRVRKMKFWYIRQTLFFFQQNEIILQGKTCSALFQFHNLEKSSFSLLGQIGLNLYRLPLKGESAISFISYNLLWNANKIDSPHLPRSDNKETIE